jgi:hypothetical protein
VWIWKDEQLHAVFTRGLLLEAGGLGPSLIVYGRGAGRAVGVDLVDGPQPNGPVGPIAGRGGGRAGGRG